MTRFFYSLSLSLLMGGIALADSTSRLPDALLIGAEDKTQICGCPLDGVRVDNAACGMPHVTYNRAHLAPWMSVRQIAEWMGMSCAQKSMLPNEQLPACAMQDERIQQIYQHPVNWIVAAPRVATYMHSAHWNWETTSRTPGYPDPIFGQCPIAAKPNGEMELWTGVRGDFARAALFLFDRYSVTMPIEVELELIELGRVDPPTMAEANRERLRRDYRQEYNLYVLNDIKFDQDANKQKLTSVMNEYRERMHQ